MNFRPAAQADTAARARSPHAPGGEAYSGRRAPTVAALPEPASGKRPKTAFTPARPASRTDGWTPERQRQFIEALAEHGSVRAACRVVGMGKSSACALRRRRDAEAFAEA